MPNLRQHQLRVAATAKIICDSLSVAGDQTKTLDIDKVVEACLFHDMGNIIKFHLDYFPEFLEPEGLGYWEKVKSDFIKKYGNDEHVATEIICREIGLSESQLGWVNSIGFTRSIDALRSGELARMICCYADQRVGPHGILSLKERQDDGRKRYMNRKDKTISEKVFESYVTTLNEIEREIFKHSSLKPEDITHEKVEIVVARLALLEK